MRAVDVIIQKRDGHALSREAIEGFVAGATDGSWPDYQVSALLMAITLRGMTPEETWALTDAMVRSGERVDLSDVPGVKVGKHSTGGVGDKVSLVLAPLVAACGLVVPKMSGRGLGHTGGTLDKLESIPGFRTNLSVDEFKRVLRDVGVSIIGQTPSLVPADKILYGLRDVTGTVESLALVSASIMSKKLAEGSSAIVLDVKCGSGGVMKDEAGARALAESMVSIGRRSGVRTEAVITDMNVPLGRAIGNALEVAECLDTLEGRGPDDLREVVEYLAARMLLIADAAPDEDAAQAAVSRALASGAALDRFRRMIECQGGDSRVLDDRSRLPSVATRRSCPASRDGYVARINAESIGRASRALGAGRNEAGESIDHAVGVMMRVTIGERVSAGQPLFDLHYRDESRLAAALELCAGACAIADAAPPRRPAILGEVR